MSRPGVVVAGGYSTRFGDRNKAVAELAGTPLVRRVADRLAPEIDSLVVNCRDEQVEPLLDALDGYPRPVTVATDQIPGRGPVAGVAAGLRAVDAEYAVVAACDMPRLDPTLVDVLAERARNGSAAVPKVDGHHQPLYAVYHAERTRSACRRLLERGVSRLEAVVAELDARSLSEETVRRHVAPESFSNVNTEAELQALASSFETV